MYLALVRLPGVSGIDHTEKKVSGIEIVDGKVNDEAVCVVKEVQLFLYIYNMINQQILQAGMKYLFDT